jgi:hypothetical protein
MKNKCYRIKGNSKYFRQKYGTPNPIIRIKGEDKDIWTSGWAASDASVCQLYSARVTEENLPIFGKVYYGKIDEFDELVHESELGEEIAEDRATLELKPCLA